MHKQKIVVSGVLTFPEGVLLAQRPLTKKIAPGKFHLPGGHVEPGEHPEEALVREFREEFQIAVTVGDVINTFTYTIGDTHTVGITFRIATDAAAQDIVLDEDTESIVFVTQDTFGHYLATSDHDYATLVKHWRRVARVAKL